VVLQHGYWGVELNTPKLKENLLGNVTDSNWLADVITVTTFEIHARRSFVLGAVTNI